MKELNIPRSVRMEAILPYFATIFILCNFVFVAKATYVTNTYSDSSNNGNFYKLELDRDTGSVYLAGKNKLYKLSSTLALEQSVVLGPKEDSPDCPLPPSLQCDFTKTMTDFVPKAMVVYYDQRRLILCTNLYQGLCEKRSLDDITELDTNIYTPMVPHDSTSSTVIFIAPSPDDSSKKVLFIGATRTTYGTVDAYKKLIPAISSRNIETYDLTFTDVLRGKSEMRIDELHTTSFFIKYIHGFSTGGFAYFITVQREATGSRKFVTKLARICEKDVHFFSYAEVPLVCNKSGTDYNIAQAAYLAKSGPDLAESLSIPPTEDVLYVTFAVGKQNSNETLANSAVCVYPMREVVRIVTQNIQECFRGLGNIGPDHFASRQGCTEATLPIGDDYCGTHDFNYPIGGNIPLQSTAVITLPSTAVTAVVVSITYNYTVAFLGTSTGHLLKVVVESKALADKYENLTIEAGSPISPDLRFDRQLKHLYVMTERKLTKLKLHDCSQYTTCSACLAAKDPYCGWCPLETKCSLRAECQNANLQKGWLPYSGSVCTAINEVSPDKVQIEQGKTTSLNLVIQNLPASSGQFQCAFTSYDTRYNTQTTTAIRTRSGIQCDTPYPNILPPIPTGKDHFVMKLSVRLNEQDFVHTNFTFFDCKVHRSCTSCTTSMYPCNWCIQRHQCTYQSDQDCLRDTLVTGQNRPGTSQRPGPENCPRIEANFAEILVPSGTTRIVSVKAMALHDFMSSFECKFYKSDRVETVPATKTGSNVIECNPSQAMEFAYVGNAQHQNVRFEITWGSGSRPLDNPSNIQVKVYKCSAMANSCGSCLTMEDKYNCGWCSGQNNVCTIQDQCLGEMDTWLAGNSVCPNPLIHSFSPKTGPIEGGTMVTIRGVNLGKTFADIQDGVNVGDRQCRPLLEYYEPATKIVCITGEVPSAKSKKVQVIVSTRFTASSVDNFSYVVPRINKIFPTLGPRSGGTILNITGTHLNAGSKIRAMVGQLNCTITHINNSTAMGITNNWVTCITSPAEDIIQTRVAMVFDDKAKKLSDEYFSYMKDPNITSVEPDRAVLSGGIRVTVTGEGLNTVQEPKMYVTYQGQDYISPCNSTSASRMICKSPCIMKCDKEEGRRKRDVNPTANTPLELEYGFIMDNVMSVRNYSRNKGDTFSIFPNPEFDPFPGGTKFFQTKNEYLTLNGKNLNLAMNEDDVMIRIGDSFCNVTSISPTQLTCIPPLKQPSSLEGNKDPEVVVSVGDNFRKTLGVIKYEEGGLSLTAIIAIGAGVGAFFLICLLIIILVCVAYRKKSQESDRVMKRMQTQMDVLEIRVAKECKEAFAELQTDMTEVTSDLSGVVGIPFVDYRTYCMRVLFPSTDEYDHPVLRDLQYEYGRQDNLEKGMKLFTQLVNNKTFLLLFVRTLESNKYFSMRERVNVASLISVALQNKMEYHTDILKTLLAELIERSVEGRNHPKLLLRRTESVAEKMLTNWFTFLLFKFLKECAGEPLFMLFRAIKQQVDKGPVDAVTSEAKYSLSEDKLIRHGIEYRTVTLNVVDMDLMQSTQYHIVRVLDCDTISQCKEKILDAIYKNAPYSLRPYKENLDLEWRTGERGRVILQDEDLTTKPEGEYKKINTLGHYKVPDGAVMALVPKQKEYMTLTSSSSMRFGHQYENSTYYSGMMHGSPSLNRTVSPTAISIEMENKGTKYYHVVKPQENEVQKDGERGSKMVSEIYLTRLLATKGTLQQFVDDLFETIFSTAHRGSALPLAIKYMFDFLDDQALLHGITDIETVHTWKSNSLPLRFWVNMIKNPNFVFDIHKSNIVDACLSVVAQTFMDSCSMSEHKLGKDSPSSKLLYAKDIPKYKKWVERYYQDIKLMPAISDQDMNAMLAEESRLHNVEFSASSAVYELYQYADKYIEQLMTSLEEDEFARKNKLASRLDQIRQYMESDSVV